MHGKFVYYLQGVQLMEYYVQSAKKNGQVEEVMGMIENLKLAYDVTTLQSSKKKDMLLT